MALYRVHIDRADFSQNRYDALDVQTPLHPSETPERLVARLIAYARRGDPDGDLVFSPSGLCDGDRATLFAPPVGPLTRWIDVGLPSVDRLRRALNMADEVEVFVHRTPSPWMDRVRKAGLADRQALSIWALPRPAITTLAATLQRRLRWQVSIDGPTMWVTVEEQTVEVVLEALA